MPRPRRVLFCVQCEEPLPSKCAKCVKHPNRKPKYVELFGTPEIFARSACGCIQIRCQRPGCFKLPWKRESDTERFKNLFCSRSCTGIVTAAAKVAKRVMLPCSCGCGRIISRPASNMLRKHVYFSQKCHYSHRMRLASQERRSIDRSLFQALCCDSERCRGAVRDHKKLSVGLYACTYCNARRMGKIVRLEKVA